MTNPAESLDVAYKVCTVIAVAGGGVWAGWKYILNKGRNAYAHAKEERHTEFERNVTTIVKEILEEVRPAENNGMGNGGTTIKELTVQQMKKFDTIEKAIGAVEQTVATVLEKVESVENRVTKIEGNQNRQRGG